MRKLHFSTYLIVSSESEGSWVMVKCKNVKIGLHLHLHGGVKGFDAPVEDLLHVAWFLVKVKWLHVHVMHMFL